MGKYTVESSWVASFKTDADKEHEIARLTELNLSSAEDLAALRKSTTEFKNENLAKIEALIYARKNK